MGRNTELSIEDANGLQIASYKVPYGSKLFFENDQKVKKGTKYVSGIHIQHLSLQKKTELLIM